MAPRQKEDFFLCFLFKPELKAASTPGEDSSPKTSLSLISFFYYLLPDSDDNNNTFFYEVLKITKSGKLSHRSLNYNTKGRKKEKDVNSSHFPSSNTRVASGIWQSNWTKVITFFQKWRSSTWEVEILVILGQWELQTAIPSSDIWTPELNLKPLKWIWPYATHQMF